jgi:hypothetical protein
MPNINMTGGYKWGVGTNNTYDVIKTVNGPKTAVAVPPGSTAFHQVSDHYFSGGSGAGTVAQYEIFRGCLAFDCTAITEAPASAVLHLSSKTGTNNYTLTNAASNHKLILLGAATGTGQAGEPGTFFDSNGANTASGAGIGPGNNDMAGWGTGNLDSAVTKLSDPFNQSLFDVSSDGDDVAITLNATGLAAMASLDIFIIYITDYTWQVQGGDPQVDTPSPGSAANTEVQFAARTNSPYTLPFITYEEVVSDFPNAENESGALVSGDFTINTFSSAVLGAQFAQTGEQVPFSLGTPGVRHLRGRTTAYATEKGEKVTDKDGRGKKGKSKR